MRLRVWALSFSILTLAHVASGQQAWTAPIGIPAPSFGIVQITPPVGVLVGSLPATMQPGSIAQLSGHITGGSLTCNGTITTPCWVLGGAATLDGDFVINGSYTILDGWHLTGVHSLGIGGDHNVVRNSTSVGTLTEPSPAAAFYVFGSNDVVYRNVVSDHGDVTFGLVDTDNHGLSVVRPADHAWILENEFARNAGDGANCNSYPYDSAGFTAINFVYFGRNLSHGNKQTGLWCKQSQDIIISQNEVYGHVPDTVGFFSYGVGIGYQYGTQRWWVIYNNVHDNTVGVGVSGDLGGEPAIRSAIVLHNVFAGVTGVHECGQGGFVWDCASVFLTGGAAYFVVDNVLPATPDGIHATRDTGLFALGNQGNQTILTDQAIFPPSQTLTTLAIYNSFKAIYGLDITGGSVPANGTVGLSSGLPVPIVPPVIGPVNGPGAGVTALGRRFRKRGGR